MTDSLEKRPELLDVLSAGPVGVSSPEDVERARERMLPWLEEQVSDLPVQRSHALSRERFRRRAQVGGGVVAVAAGVAFAVFSGPQEPSGSAAPVAAARADEPVYATLVSGELAGASGRINRGERVAIGGRLETKGDEGAALQASFGYQLELGPASALSFESTAGAKAEAKEASEIRLRLHRGTAKFSVLPLPQGSTVTVVTGDTLVSAFATAFTLEAHDGASTCVRVAEGKATVRRGASSETLGAGQSSGCPSDSSEGEKGEDEAERTPSAPNRPVTTLSQENALLSQALAAESRGEKQRAKRAYKKLLRDYPRSSFAQDARAGLARLDQPIK